MSCGGASPLLPQQRGFKLVPGFKPQATSAQATSHKLLDRGSRIKYRGASTVALD